MKYIFVFYVIQLLGWHAMAQFSQLGQDINGFVGEQYGYDSALNGDGSRIVIGAPHSSVNGLNEGAVRVYEFNGTNWIQIGQTLMGSGLGNQDYFGNSVKINYVGDRIVVGSVGFSSISSNQDGAVYVFEFDGINWVQLGARIDAVEGGELLGYSVSMNGIGLRVIAGVQSKDGLGSGLGAARVYDYNGIIW